MKTIKQQSPIFIQTATIDIKFTIVVDNREWTVEGFVEARTGIYTPTLIDCFGVSQFASDVAKMSVDDLVKKLRKMVAPTFPVKVSK